MIRFNLKKPLVAATKLQNIVIAFVMLYLQVILPASAHALTPQEIVVIANRNVSDGIELAQQYMQARSVPEENLILLDTSVKESISRDDFDRSIADPLKEFLRRSDPDSKRFKCLLVMYGLPLRIEPPRPTESEVAQANDAINELNEVSSRAENLQSAETEELIKIKQQIIALKQKINILLKKNYGAALDSELALVREDSYKLDGWVLNRFFAGFKNKILPNMPLRPMLVSRLDGPDRATVSRMIKDSIEAEDEGLKGKAYFDARWPYSDQKTEDKYRLYDRSIHKSAKIVKESGRMEAVLDQDDKLFGPGTAPDAALYCGWYSLGKYIDAFKWSKGAVGYHIASSECATLKNQSNTGWCRMILMNGAAATIGPVAEPYVNAFPFPEIFFALLLDGRVALAEAYALSVPYWSWQMILIGDPLYRPFKTSGLLKNK
ncbi:MAG: TIGR03790 family protein [Dissulfurispiraceae bacterium]|jgi:uncharacterized protein (TIGR03790 family)|nr:TIGR03790 family protein [Dissulfurispiraceae bacterium]